MERADFDADMLAADQELSVLLEKHINLPMKKSIEQVSGSLSLTLKGDFDAQVLSLRSELKKLGSTFEYLGDDLSSIRNVSNRIETMAQQAEVAHGERSAKVTAAVLGSEGGVKDALAGVEERLGKLSAGQLQHFNALLKVQAAEVHKQRSEHQDTQQRILEKLDELTALSATQASREIQSHQASKGRFVWLLTGLAVNCAVLLTLLAKSFLAAGI